MRPAFISTWLEFQKETVWPSRMCCSIPWMITPLKSLNISTGNLPYIPNFENNRILMILNFEENTCRKLV
jgi:hypothetical protein